MADFGTDISAFPDLDPSFALVTGTEAYLQAIARRYVTPRGALWAHPTYGEDVRDWLLESLTTASMVDLKRVLEEQAEMDERTISARAVVSYDSAAERITFSVELETAEGPFVLVMGVSSLTAEVLDARRG